MDKLRGIEYFVRVVEFGAFTAAARALDVSVPAVSRSIAALERTLGTTLLRRESRRLVLTPDGEIYHRTGQRMLSELSGVEAELAGNRARASGKLVVGAPEIICVHALAPTLPEFLRQHPALEFDLRVINAPSEPAAAHADMLLHLGVPRTPQMIARCVATPRFVVSAAPRYWQEYGLPNDPDELRHHACIMRRSRGRLVDRWRFERNGERRRVELLPRVVFDSRGAQLEAVVAGLGVARTMDLFTHRWLADGRLQPALVDWVALDAPPIYLLYRRGARVSARERAFMQFVQDAFARLRAQGVGA
jgi:LysR family transcriptional activator of dmlA